MTAAILADRGIVVQHPDRPGEHRAPCPECARGSRDDALAVRIEAGGGATWICHRCGWSGGLAGERQEQHANRPPVRQERRAEPERYDDTLAPWAITFWSACKPIEPGTVAATYLERRGCALPPQETDLRWRPDVRHPSGHVGPALVALVTDAITAEPISLHRTWIKPDGSGKAAIDKPRLLLAKHRSERPLQNPVHLWLMVAGRGLAEVVMRRETRQLSLAEALVSGGKSGERLARIFVVLDWPALEAVLGDLRAAPTGRPGYPPLVMLRVLLLAQWYGLSDPELEEALADRLSFRRFAGLPLDGPVPDETTICRFRGELVRRALSARLLAAVEAQLAAKGLVLRRGTLIDATLIEADADVRKGPDGRPVTVEREAGFARRRGRAFFGFKAHLAVDQGSGLVRRTRLTAANVNETLVADALILGDEAAVYADKAYDSLARRAALAACGIGDGILRRGNRRPLTRAEVARNRALVPIRSAIERVFGTLKRHYGWTRVRYRGLARNATHLDLLCLALNLRRADVLTR